MPQLVRIAHHVQRLNDVARNLEGRSLHRSVGSVHNHTGQTIDGHKAQRKILARRFARDANKEPRHAIGTIEHVQRRRRLAAAVRHDAHVAREQLHERIEIARARGRNECGHQLRMLRIDLARTLRRRRGAAWSYSAHVRACPGRKLPARSLAPVQCRGHFTEREIEHLVQQEGSPLERREPVKRQKKRY